jgi:hypothetical protein
MKKNILDDVWKHINKSDNDECWEWEGIFSEVGMVK